MVVSIESDSVSVYDITEYVRDHPGGTDVLLDSAGSDATKEYLDVGHSEDADAIMESYCIGVLKDAPKVDKAKSVVRLIDTTKVPASSERSGALGAVLCAGGLGVTAFGVWARYPHILQPVLDVRESLVSNIDYSALRMHSSKNAGGSFTYGFVAATLLCTSVGAFVAKQLSRLTHIEHGFERFPPHIPSHPRQAMDLNSQRGFVEPQQYKDLPLVSKTQLAPSVFRLTFKLPKSDDIVGIPIGQHVVIKANIDGKSVSRSYTPISNNTDRGKMDLLIKCYPDGQLTGRYISGLQIGDRVSFRGPKGPMKYRKGLCSRIGMIAGGTGITPMYQLIRAICEHEKDQTEVHLIYANRSENDILLRDELEHFARNYPKNFKLWYMLDQPPKDWTYGSGYVTSAVISAKLPGPSEDTKIMLCGPPGMVTASKKALVSMGFRNPGASAKIDDQIFCF